MKLKIISYLKNKYKHKSIIDYLSESIMNSSKESSIKENVLEYTSLLSIECLKVLNMDAQEYENASGELMEDTLMDIFDILKIK